MSCGNKSVSNCVNQKPHCMISIPLQLFTKTKWPINYKVDEATIKSGVPFEVPPIRYLKAIFVLMSKYISKFDH